jgi:ATP-dependent Clp protease ATP-binding subunit ClpC
MMKESFDDEHLKKPLDVQMSVSDDDDEDDARFKGGPGKGNSKSKTPILDTFGRDLTRMAEEGKIDPVIGRDKEIERMSQILSRRKKNNPIMIGEPGVGKTSVAEALALRIAQRKVSRTLFNKKIYMLDIASMVAGTKYRGQFEERIKGLMTELEKEPDIILFIDEIHTIIGAGGSSGSLDASNMFKPALSRGDLQIIGATTMEEYRKHIEKDGALERRFQKVIVRPTTEDETIQILHNIKEKYEKHHNVTYTDDAIKSCVMLTSRYITDKHLPDKAIDALDEAGSRVHISNIVVPKEITDIEQKVIDIKDKKAEVVRGQRYEEAAKLRDVEKQLQNQLEDARRRWEEGELLNRQTVSEENVAEVVSMMSGIPLQKVNQTESKKLSNMSAQVIGKVVGQDEAVRKVVKSIQRGRVGMKDPNKPLGVFLFAGDTGTGKTHLAKTIAKYLYDSEDNLIRVDMSEFMEKISITRLIGASAGYVGYDDSTILDQIRRKPYSVILLDEIEKAHPDVFNLFLQAFDEGHLTDSHGRKIDLKNCIIIMTSNVGVKRLKDFGTGVGFKTKSANDNIKDEQEKVIQEEIKKQFKPEFINRIDSIVVFNSLTQEDIKKIIDIELIRVYDRVSSIEFKLEIEEGMKEHLFNVGWDPSFGARPLKRAIQRWIEDEITEFIIENEPEKGSLLKVDYNSEENKSVVTSSKPRKTKKD